MKRLQLLIAGFALASSLLAQSPSDTLYTPVLIKHYTRVDTAYTIYSEWSGDIHEYRGTRLVNCFQFYVETDEGLIKLPLNLPPQHVSGARDTIIYVGYNSGIYVRPTDNMPVLPPTKPYFILGSHGQMIRID